MPNGSDVLGSAFRLPQSAPVSQQPAAQLGGGGGFTPFEPEQGLLTGVAEESQYFDQLQDLNQYVEEKIAAGVDPTRPDITNPDSVLANRIFRDKLKRTQQLANKLKYLGDLQKQRAVLEMRGQVLPSTSPQSPESVQYAQQQAPTVQQLSSTLPTELLPVVSEYNRAFAGKGVKKSELGKADNELKKAKLAVEEEVEALRQTGQYTDEALEQYRIRNIESLKPAVEKTEFKPTSFGQKQENLRRLIVQRDKILKFAQAGNKWAGEKFIDREFNDTPIAKSKFNPETQEWEFYDDLDLVIGKVPKDDVGTLNTILDSRRDASETISIEEYEDGISRGWTWGGETPDAPRAGDKILDTDTMDEDLNFIITKGEGEEAAVEDILNGIPGLSNIQYVDKFNSVLGVSTGEVDAIAYTNESGRPVQIKLDEDGIKELRRLMAKHPKYQKTVGQPMGAPTKPRPY